MVIEKLGINYRVTGRQSAPGNDNVFICESLADGKQYLVTAAHAHELDAGTVDFLYKQTANPTFSDLADCFVDRGRMYLAFRMYTGQPLREIMDTELLTLSERLNIMRRILEYAVLQSMSSYFLCRCLDTERIFFTRAAEISFKYQIDDLVNYGSYSMKHVRKALLGVTIELFQEELKKEVAPPIKEFVDALQAQDDGTCLELYRSFSIAAGEVLKIKTTELETPKTKPFRIWDKLKKGIKPVKRIIAAAVLIFVLVYMILTYRDARKKPEAVSVISKIGTLDIV